MSKIIMASGPVIVEDDKVLLNKHGDDKFYKFCGGKVDDLEHFLVEHAQREVMEEMGIQLRIIEKAPYIFLAEKLDSDNNKIADIVLFHYLSQRIGEINPGADIDDWHWVSVMELADLEKAGELAPNIIPALKHFRFI